MDPVTRRNEPLLLRLPEELRHQVYLWLNYKRQYAVDFTRHFDGCECANCKQGPFAYQLFLVSRAVSKDSREFFYSVNEFQTFGWRLCYVSPIRKLTPVALASLRQLCIPIQIPACVKNGEFTGSPEERESFEDYKKLMRVWRKFCCQLAAHTEPGRLDLAVRTDASTREMAEIVLEPLQQFPLFRHLSIGLGSSDDSSLHLFVQELVQRLTGQEPGPEVISPFRFGDLPTEMRLTILERSGVVGPRYLKWHEKKHAFFDDWCISGRCTGWPGARCILSHSAFSSKGNCFEVPRALFQASQAIKDEAEFLFYSRSRFSVQIGWPYRQPQSSAWPINDSVFLVPIPAHCVQHLRYFRWVFRMELDDTSFRPGQPETDDLKKGVEFLAQNAVLSKLTLILDFSQESDILAKAMACEDPDEMDPLREHWPEDEEAEEIKTDLYYRVIEIVSSLKGLKNFFVLVSWPLDHGCGRVRREKILERIVMGSEYDSSPAKEDDDLALDQCSSWDTW